MRFVIPFLILFACVAATQGAGFVSKDLVGEWKGKARDGTEIRYTFKEDGKVIWQVEETGFRSMAPDGLEGVYVVEIGKPRWKLDISNFKHPAFSEFKFEGILQMFSKKRMKMDGRPSPAGERPKRFTEEAIVFQRVE